MKGEPATEPSGICAVCTRFGGACNPDVNVSPSSCCDFVLRDGIDEPTCGGCNHWTETDEGRGVCVAIKPHWKGHSGAHPCWRWVPITKGKDNG